jgi:hypothetical protein
MSSKSKRIEKRNFILNQASRINFVWKKLKPRNWGRGPQNGKELFRNFSDITLAQ